MVLVGYPAAKNLAKRQALEVSPNVDHRYTLPATLTGIVADTEDGTYAIHEWMIFIYVNRRLIIIFCTFVL